MLHLVVFVASVCVTTVAVKLPPPCDSKIYCISSPTSLLHVVQRAKLFDDSKTFVDMAIKTTPVEVLVKFQEMMNETSNKPSNDTVWAFLQENFEPEGSEFVNWEPTDWSSEISLFDKIKVCS